MDFSEVVAQVLDITKRPDKQTQTEVAVNAAITEFLTRNSFSQDLVEATVAISNTEYSNTVDLSTETTRFRKFKYVKLEGLLSYLKPIAHENVFSPSGYMQKDVYYITGRTLTTIQAYLASNLEVGYYQYPATLSGTDNHWLLDLNPYCVIDKAASRIFKTIGDDNSFKTHLAMAEEQYKTVVRDLVDGVS